MGSSGWYCGFVEWTSKSIVLISLGSTYSGIAPFSSGVSIMVSFQTTYHCEVSERPIGTSFKGKMEEGI